MLIAVVEDNQGLANAISEVLTDGGHAVDVMHSVPSLGYTVQTVGSEVVDTFYVRDWAGSLIDDPAHRHEIERAVLHAIT